MKKRNPTGQNPNNSLPNGDSNLTPNNGGFVYFTAESGADKNLNNIAAQSEQLTSVPDSSTGAWLQSEAQRVQQSGLKPGRRMHPKRGGKKRKPLAIALNAVIVLLVVIGIYLVSRPLILQWNRDRSTQALLHGLEVKMSAGNSKVNETLWVDPNANPINGEDYDLPPGVNADDLVINEKKNDKGQVLVEAIGRIMIESVNINLPIVKGATETPLKYGAGWYDYSSKIGEKGGNAVILAHRMLTYGRMFNRLDEVKNGDIVEINYNNQSYKYKVFESFSVDPKQQDMYEFFKPLQNGKTVITLVTCSKDDGKTRLMVRAELVS